jgi:hypothetical protein
VRHTNASAALEFRRSRGPLLRDRARAGAVGGADTALARCRRRSSRTADGPGLFFGRPSARRRLIRHPGLSLGSLHRVRPPDFGPHRGHAHHVDAAEYVRVSRGNRPSRPIVGPCTRARRSSRKQLRLHADQGVDGASARVAHAGAQPSQDGQHALVVAPCGGCDGLTVAAVRAG